MNLIMHIVYLQGEDMVFFEPSKISEVQAKVAETIKRSIDSWEVKLLKWQQHILNQLVHGTQYTSMQNIDEILCVSSIFRFSRENEHTYTDFLATDEIANIRLCILSEFEILEIPKGIKEFVEENKKVCE